MSYLRGEDVLPIEVLDLVQKYVSGKNIYIPSKEKKNWGESTSTKAILESRNKDIVWKYQCGATIKDLSKEYFMTEKAFKELLETVNALVLRKAGYQMNYCNTIKVYHRCGGCGKKRQFVNTGRFRVNANGKNLDVWIIYQCVKCKHSWNLTVYERKKSSIISVEEYQLFLENDQELACRFGNDMAFLKRNKAEFK